MTDEEMGLEESSVSGAPVPPLYTRLRYAGFLFVVFLICLIVRDGMFGAFNKFPVLKDGCEQYESCGTFTGHQLVFRLTFACVVFFAINGSFMLKECCCVTNEQKNDFQAEYFCPKICVFVLLTFVTFFIPNGFFETYSTVCIFGSGLFLVIQAILLIDFLCNWNDSWAEKSEDESRWGTYLILLTFLFFGMALTAIILMYVFFTGGDDCDLPGALITTTLVLGIVYTALSIKQPTGSIFVSSVIFVYTSVICFTALRNGIEPACNALASSSGGGMTWSIVLSSLFMGCSIAWASASAGAQRNALSLSGPSDDDEDKQQADNYLFFHFIMALGSMYMAMILTNWGTDDTSDDPSIGKGKITMWVQISSQWLVVFLYLFSLIAPTTCCKDRNYDF
eukprot:TRINITY_DN1659_c4_g1_i1.p1 TRINITY_DN1659_c4_g1~~TRINITY_DN1659_c4_g1_i1.p1  ORF type:complete len:394 (+),score=65.36 TRINITY_DN1659_c4_g1_i1:50-1231(+)